MGKISILPKDVISQIAAGEVVSSPVDVVKELIENSIDADATDIQVRLTDGGIKEITVLDNGCGMSKEDLLLCYQEHATSKITSHKDLEKISSFGFRGEALYSLCIAGNVDIKSKPTESLEGYSITLKNGKRMDLTAIGMPTGTCVSVYDLFQEMPARKKFLKDSEKELKAVRQLVLSIALAYPKIRFRLYHNGNSKIDLLQSNDDARFKDIFGKDFTKEYLEINNIANHFVISGYISLPSYARKSMSANSLFVNGRLVQSTVVTNAVKAAYHDLLEEKKIPGYILFLKTPLDYVDINVHPKKERISFLNDSDIFDFIYSSVHAVLQANDLTVIKEGFSTSTNYMRTYLGDLKSSYKEQPLNDVTSFIQVHALFLIRQTDKGILLIDQHAAHERILYEKLLSLYENKNSEQLTLNPAINLRLSLQDQDLLNTYLDTFIELGFDINIFDQTCVINKVPLLFENRNIKTILLELLDDLQIAGSKTSIDSRGKLALSYLACRTAIKSGEKLTSKEAAALLNELQNTKTHYICPHGRPALVEIPLREIEKLFMR